MTATQHPGAAGLTDERKAFEAWTINAYNETGADWNLSRDSADEYRSFLVRCWWQAWQARAAIASAQRTQEPAEYSDAWLMARGESAERQLHAAASALIAAATHQEQAPAGWQPIETAPKDGTKFLGYRRGEIATSYRTPRDDCEMWTFGGASGSFEFYPNLRPTHWMPLPPPPATKDHP